MQGIWVQVNKRPRFIIIALITIILFIGLLSIAVGTIYVPLDQVGLTVLGQPTENAFIIQRYRAPRVMLSVFVGAGLAMSGAILQGVLRNPLASPDVIGITKGAGLAASITIILFPASPVIALPLSAFAGAMLVAALLFGFVYRRDGSPISLTLTGIALGAMCNAGIQYLIVKHPVNVNTALVWLTGSVYGRGWDEVVGVFPWLGLLFPLALASAGKLDILHLGDDVATGLGENSKRLRLCLVAVAVALAGVSVAAVGAIGFVGLIAPHMARRLVGAKYGVLLPVAGLLGAILILVADTLGRILCPPLEFPAGLITAVVGAPYFLYVLRRERRCAGDKA